MFQHLQLRTLHIHITYLHTRTNTHAHTQTCAHMYTHAHACYRRPFRYRFRSEYRLAYKGKRLPICLGIKTVAGEDFTFNSLYINKERVFCGHKNVIVEDRPPSGFKISVDKGILTVSGANRTNTCKLHFEESGGVSDLQLNNNTYDES